MRQSVDSDWVFARYEQLRPRLPSARFPGSSSPVTDLGELADRFDTFVFDSFGVLNVGGSPIRGAVERISHLRAAGKHVFVLTNAASVPLRNLEAKYTGLGFDFSADEIVSSRAVLAGVLNRFDDNMLWSVIAPEDADIGELPVRTRPWQGVDDDTCDGIIFLSSSGWNDNRQQTLIHSLERKPRPVLIGNPDLVAPREASLTMEPGAYAHDIADRLPIEPEYFGKPFGNAFEFLFNTAGVKPERSLMLGDTLHTDILGGCAAGMSTALVTGHGVMRDMNPSDCIAASGIVPDYTMPSI